MIGSVGVAQGSSALPTAPQHASKSLISSLPSRKYLEPNALSHNNVAAVTKTLAAFRYSGIIVLPAAKSISGAPSPSLIISFNATQEQRGQRGAANLAKNILTM